MSGGHELPPNPYSDGPLANASPKATGGRCRTVLYVLHIVVTVAIMFVTPGPAKIVSIAAWLLMWAMLNTLKKDVPALAGGWTSFSMFVITVLASWISSGTMQFSHVQDVRTLEHHFMIIDERLREYHESHGFYPQSLSDPTFEFPSNDRAYDLQDSWNRPILYTVEVDGFRLSSFGRDGKIGGIGLDSDWSYHSSDAEPYRSPFRNTPDIPLPLWQFLFDTPSSTTILIFVVPMCLIAGHGAREEAQGVTQITRSMIFTACITTLIVAAVSTFLSLFLVAASQSGH